MISNIRCEAHESEEDHQRDQIPKSAHIGEKWGLMDVVFECAERWSRLEIREG
jgi:hypothetical protein